MFCLHEQYFEIQENDFLTSSSNVKGRLAENIEFWRNIGANPEIVNILQEGYKIPFFESPPELFSKNNVSALQNMNFVEEAVLELEKSNRVVQTPFKPWVVSPLSVSINKSDKKRLILDLRLINKLIWKQKIRFEDYTVASEYFEKDSFCFKFDLSKGYHHINIFPGHQTFLGFSIKGNYYCFTVLPFGLSSAPYIFSKVLREMVKYWRSHCIKIVMFLDDGWGTNSNRRLCSADANFVRNSLEKAGFVINYGKSVWEPVQKLEWLGLFWDSEHFSIYIPERRINDLRCSLETLFSYLPNVTARKLAQCVGKVISMMPVIGNIARLMTRRCYVIIENRQHLDSILRLESNDFCITELNFWRRNIHFLNMKKFGGYRCPDTLVFSDASNVACGSYVVNANNLVFHSNWSEEQKAKSSTFRELRAVYLALRAYSFKFKNGCVKWFSDSLNCVRIVSAGSTKPDLQDQALNIFQLCLRWNIDLDIQWVPRDFNFVADSISKVRCTDNLGVSEEFFLFMQSKWGPFDIDRFANSENRKLFRYNSRFFDYQCEAVDAFSQNWKNSNNWLVPPIHLVSKTVFHLLACGGKGCLIVPKWPSASFWPLIFKAGEVKREFVKDVLEFSSNQNIFIKGKGNVGIFGTERFKSKVLAIRF